MTVIGFPIALGRGADRTTDASSDPKTRRVKIRISVSPEGTTAPGARDDVEQLVTHVIEREERLLQVARKAGLSPDALVDLIEGALVRPETVFSEVELATFADAGISLAGPKGDASGLRAQLRGRALMHGLVEDGLTVAQAADLLAVTQARVRQRIAEGALVSIRLPEGQVLPRWQFVDKRVVPWLERFAQLFVLLHPLEVAAFMTRPNVDLQLRSEPTTPVVWLSQGGDATPVLGLLQALTYA